MKALIRILIVLVVIGLLGGGAWWFFVLRADGQESGGYTTATVTRGEVVAKISATGTVEPEELVDVGAQVAGQIRSFGKDTAGKIVDYGSLVESGAVLAEIDDALYQADVSSARAALAQAEAGVTRADADVAQSEAKLGQAARDWERAQKLGPSDALAATTFDSYKAAYETAQAALAVSKAQVLQAKATVEQSRNSLMRAERNLGYCVIKSPVSGVIIDRRVNIGQTVVSSLNAPSLFLIAKDLKRMQVWVAVNEADIGQIKPGLPVSFTVDAFPDGKFRGTVGKVRLNATMTQNVVTYTVEVDTDNSDGRLLPYLTANIQFETAKKENVLYVPNAALRWKPEAESAAGPGGGATSGGGSGAQASASSGPPAGTSAGPAEGRGSGGPPGGGRPPGGGDRPRGEGRKRDQGGGRSNQGQVYVLDGTTVRPIEVKTGLTDGAVTEVEGEGLAEGMTIVTGENKPKDSGQASTTTNPFAPQMPRGGMRGMGR